MGRQKKYTPLNIYVGSNYAGQLIRESTGAYQFKYSQEWLDWDFNFPLSLSLPVREDRYVGQEVINVFENLLPENDEIRNHIATHVGAEGTDAFSMLSKIGKDCVGAMQFLPDGEEFSPFEKIEGRSVTEEEIESILNNLGRAPLGMGEDDAFRISIAGAQEKTALLFHKGEWIKPHGPTPTTHIIKPQIGRLEGIGDLSDSVENEYLCLKIIKEFGLPTAQTEMHKFGSKKALVVERFDRRWTRDKRLIRLPQEDCCQALSVPSTRKYQNKGGLGMVEIAELLKGSDTAEKDRIAFMTANILFWLMGATDGHAKNFSVFIGPGGTYHLAPIYDVLTVQPSLDKNYIERRQYQMSMHVGEKRRYRVYDIRGKDFLFTGQKSGYSKEQILNAIADIERRWETVIDSVAKNLDADFPTLLIESIRGGFKQRISRMLELD
jgi:serine/threonine-protein kinase HipA